MTEPRDTQSTPRSPAGAVSSTDHAASEVDLRASALLDDWLIGSPYNDAEQNHGAPTGRAGAMLDARNALRSHGDAASSIELDQMIESALEQLDAGSQSPGEGTTAGAGRSGDVRQLVLRRRWIAATAAAILGIVTIGALVVQGSNLEESAQDTGVSSISEQPSQAARDESGVAADAATPSSLPGSPENSPAQESPAPEQDTEDALPPEPGTVTEPGGSGSSGEADGNAFEKGEGARAPGSIFAGVHTTGQVRLR